MNIAVDMTAILGPMSKNRGIGNYALGQFKKMVEIDPFNTYIFINFFEECNISEYFPGSNNITELSFYTGKNRFLLDKPEYKEIFGDIIRRIISENSIDVFYLTSPFESGIHHYEKSWFQGIKTVATVYDIIPYVFKDRYLSDKGTYNWYMKCIDMLKWVDCHFVISDSVKQDMVNQLGFDEKKIKVIYGAVDDRFRIIDVSEDQRRKVTEKFSIIDEFIMCTGGDDDRKNISELIIAYSQLPKDLISKYHLVIVCKLSSEALEKYIELSHKRDVAGRVVFTNYVTNEELVLLYNMAQLMAFPSQYEGFGLPVVEAMSCGTPVLTSNNSSLKEIALDAATLVDPFDTKDITRGLKEALLHTDLNDMVEKGIKRIERFTWDIVAQKTIDALNNLVNSSNLKVDVNRVKDRIAFFSPMPPIESGISDYSVDIVDELSNYFDIDVFVDDKYTVECNLADNVKVLHHSLFKRTCHEYKDIVYQMGNSFFHVYMYDYIRKHPGTVVLHDYNMHGVAQAVTLHQGHHGTKQYQQFLLEDYPKSLVNDYLKDLKDGVCGVKIYEMELNGYIVNHAKKMIVHSEYAKEKLLTKDIARKVKKINSYAKIEPLADCSNSKKQLGFQEDEMIIASFGHVHNTKRALPVLEAFKRVSEENEKVKLLLVGKLDESIKNVVEGFIHENNLSDRIQITGYTSLESFENYINATDICVNLRYPYNGETSGSLMRILSKGKCVIVNNIGSFSEIPDDCCAKLPSVDDMGEYHEVDAIHNALSELVINQTKREFISHNAREFAKKNLDIKIIAQEYMNFIQDGEASHLTEKTLANITKREIGNGNYSNTEVSQLSRTLAYSMMR